MNRTFQTNKKPLVLAIEFECTQPVLIRIEGNDKSSPYTSYFLHELKLTGKNKYNIRFPKTPNTLYLKVYPASYSSYNDYITFGKSQPRKFKITKTEVVLEKPKPTFSRFMKNMLEAEATDAIIIT